MKLIQTITLGLIFSLSNLVFASTPWTLENDQSTLNFISTKKSSIAEINSFTQISGNISTKGEVEVLIDLTSVETNIGIRNERMQKFLFETDKFPQASIKTLIEASTINNLNVGDKTSQKVTIKLSLHGEVVELESKIAAILLSKNKLLVTSVVPIILDTNQLKLMQGVDKLKELAGLPSISSAVPVSFQLTFVRKD